MSATGLLLLRLGVAIVTVTHGLHTLFGVMGGPGSGVGPGGLNQMGAQFTAMGLPGGFLLAVLAGVAQVVGGVLIVAGFLVRYSAGVLATLTAFVAWKSQAPWGFFLNWVLEPGRGHGIEYSVLLFAAYVCLALTGGGEWSFDGRKAKRRSYVSAGRARLRGRG